MALEKVSLFQDETFFNVTKSRNSKIANNLLTLRLAVLNKQKIKLVDLNLSLEAFKFEYKQILMSPQLLPKIISTVLNLVLQ